MRRWTLPLILVSLIGACSGLGPPEGSPSAPAPESPGAPSPGPTVAQPSRPPTGTPPLATVPPTPPGAIGEVPEDILDDLVEEAAGLAGLGRDDIEVLRAERVRWPDGSLGCPQPGEPYPQEPVDGYWVVLQAGDETYDFRVGEAGVPRLCPAGAGRPTLATPAPAP